jgi:hypothetical protein
MVEAFFGFKKTPFSDSPEPKQLFPSQSWNQVKTRLQILVDHHGAGLITGEGILRKVNKLALTALRLAAASKTSIVGEAILLDATTEALL